MNIIFMGTTNFSLSILESIYKKHNIILIVTQTDSYNYKKKTYTINPVKKFAQDHFIEVFQPDSIKKDFEKIVKLKPDLIVTAAYGQIIPKILLDLPRYKCINVHGSILPKYRGGAPIQRAIMNGEKETGVTFMYMEEKMDSGDIIDIKKVRITEDDDQESVFEKLASLGSMYINDVIENLDKITPIKQNEEEVTYAPIIKKEDELIDFNDTSINIFNKIRGLKNNPTAYFLLDNLPVKVYNSRVSNNTHNTKCGVVVLITPDYFEVSCGGNSVIQILELQLPSKNKIKSKDFLNGSGKKLIYLNKEI